MGRDTESVTPAVAATSTRSPRRPLAARAAGRRAAGQRRRSPTPTPRPPPPTRRSRSTRAATTRRPPASPSSPIAGHADRPGDARDAAARHRHDERRRHAHFHAQPRRSAARSRSPTPSATAAATTSTASVTVEVAAPADHVPTAVADTFAGHENAVITGNVASNDTPSADGGNAWALASGAAHGTVTLNADGTFSYTPGANYSGPDSFTYTITDVDGSTSTATVTLAVAPAPLAGRRHRRRRGRTRRPAARWPPTTRPAAGETNTWCRRHARRRTARSPSTPTAPTPTSPAANYSGTDTFTYTITARRLRRTATAHVECGRPARHRLHRPAPRRAGRHGRVRHRQPHRQHAARSIDGTGEPNSTVRSASRRPAARPSSTPPRPTPTATGASTWRTATPVSGALPAGGLPDGDVALGVSTTNGTGVRRRPAAHGGRLEPAHRRHRPEARRRQRHRRVGHRRRHRQPAPGPRGHRRPLEHGHRHGHPGRRRPITYTPPPTPAATGRSTPVPPRPRRARCPPRACQTARSPCRWSPRTPRATSPPAAAASPRPTPPAASIDLRHDGTDDTGASPNDGVTEQRKPVIQGTGEPTARSPSRSRLPGAPSHLHRHHRCHRRLVAGH